MISVKYFNSGMSGAPSLTNNWGDLIALLDACLVTGFALKTVNSLTCADGVATATISSGHSYAVGQVVTIAGCNEAAYNGEQRVTNVTSTTFQFAVAGTPTSPATTTSAISAKVAHLGWDKPFSGTNKAAYRSADVQSNRHYLRVDDAVKVAGAGVAGGADYTTTWAKWANVGICESMTDIDTPVGAQAPFDPARPTRNWAQVGANQWGWHKWYHARQGGSDFAGDGGASVKSWVLIGDGRTFYLLISYTGGGRSFYSFGDPIGFKTADGYSTMLCADDVADSNSGLSYVGQFNGYGLVASLDCTGKLLLRDYSQLGNPVRWGATSLQLSNGQSVSGRGSMPFPNGPDYAFWLLPMYMIQESAHARGLLPGIFWMPQNLPYTDLTIVDNVAGYAGRKFMLLRQAYVGNQEAMIAFDMTGPWR